MTVNKKLFNEIADAVEKEPSLYDQSYWGNCDCGSPACIAGWAVHLAGVSRATLATGDGIDVVAAQQLFGSKAAKTARADLLQIFSPWWPNNWFSLAGVKPKGRDLGVGYDRKPTAGQAVKICRAIADGKIPEKELISPESEK